MKKMFLVRTHSDRIYELDVVRESEACLWITEQKAIESGRDAWDSSHKDSPQRIKRTGAYHDTFRTLENAVEFVRVRLEKEISSLQNRAASVRERLKDFDERAKVMIQQ